MKKIKIVDVYTDKPGARYNTQGPYSGEDFREKILYPIFKECLDNNETLEVDLDGGYGYGSSFLEETFGGMVRLLYEKNIEPEDIKKQMEIIKIISKDNESWVMKIARYINEAVNNL